MAHIVPNPPPKWYRDATISKFNVISWNGVARVVAWGIPARGTNDEFMIAHVGTGYDGDDILESEISGGPYKDLKTFTVRGLLAGDRIAIFRNSNFGTPFDVNWVQHSGAVEIASVAADRWAKALAEGKLPTYANNSNIRFYPFGSQQRKRPIKERDWLNGVIRTLDKMHGNALGRQVIAMITSPLIIRPWVPSYENADSAVHFTAQDWAAGRAPGESPDEVLFHEFIHVIEQDYFGYDDKPSFRFDKADFMSVNATNVYSCLLGTALRRDHNGSQYLPQEYFTNPRKHFDEFSGNYAKAKTRTPALYQLLKTSSNLWNPFIF